MRFTITCAWLVAFLLPLVAATPLPAPNPEALGLAEPDANPGPNPDVTRINLAARATPTAGPHKGIATFYNTNISGNRVACGGTYNWNRPIVAVTWPVFNSWGTSAPRHPNDAPICGQHVKITANGKTHLAEIRDICPTCGGTYDLDMSPSLFAYFGYTDHHGIFPITWEYVSGKQHLPNLPIPSWARPYFVRTGEI
ncbi:uncharacterized protein EHS24_009171 [Apiotrichum porosum]|uniref:RlpA-like protein double-psi beta-barrel domain-containing protein n=1 Tax=Apiotrichum porosum TaxID=105984 RepID=A0A427XNV1_9TREE|nr:uncharacterized protein EHS24_009171 [Apiotrichum porosum]RSH80589.1 hypothetical protein EHS24_009171 [Apiotrichum porosum]